jgi:hypothetical protein
VGEELSVDQWLTSRNKLFWLTFHKESRPIVYNRDGIFWRSSDTKRDGAPAKLTLRATGELVLVLPASNETKLAADWSSLSGRKNVKNPVLVLQDNGRAAIICEGLPIWQSEIPKLTNPIGDRFLAGEFLSMNQELTSPNGEYNLIFQGDNNIVLRKKTDPKWASRTVASEEAKRLQLIMGFDDCLYLGYPFPQWSSETRRRSGNGGASLIVRDSGDAVVIADKTIIWATNHKLVQNPGLKNVSCLALKY